jgi:predicted Zn-dependent peptidase
MLAMGWRLPASQRWGDPPSAALELASELLLAPTGPLERRLVREEGLAYRIWGRRDDTVDPGLFRIGVEAVAPDDLPKIEAIVREEVAAMAEAVEPAQLEALQTHLRQRFRSSLDDPRAVLETLGHALRRDPDPAGLLRTREALAATTAEDLSAAVRTTLVDRSLTVVTLVPPADRDEQADD